MGELAQDRTRDGGDGSEAPSDASPESSFDRQRRAGAELKLSGRYQLDDGSEHPCETVEIWPGGVRLKTAKPGPWGSGVLAYIDGLGRVEGVIVRRFPDGFALAIRANPRKEGRLRERIGSLIEGPEPAGPERRRALRTPVEHERVSLRIGGRERKGELLDVSVEGAALLVDADICLGDDLWLYGRLARVVRRFSGGVAVLFA